MRVIVQLAILSFRERTVLRSCDEHGEGWGFGLCCFERCFVVCRQVHRDPVWASEQNQEGCVAGCNGMEMCFKPLQRLQAELRCRQAGKLTDERPTGGSAGLTATTRLLSVWSFGRVRSPRSPEMEVVGCDSLVK